MPEMSLAGPWLSVPQLRACCERSGLRCDATLAQERNDYSNFEERMARALSWLARAERLGPGGECADDQLIFCWIAFNSLYAGYAATDARPGPAALDFASERRQWSAFLEQVAQGVRARRFAEAFDALRAPVTALVNNPYVLHAFWRQMDHPHGRDWQEEFERDRRAAGQFYARRMQRDARPPRGGRRAGRQESQTGQEGVVARCVFDRVYVLRNQIIHGAAGYGDGYNREQVRVSAALMLPLLCVLVQAIAEESDASPAVVFGAVGSPPQGGRPDTTTAYPTALSD